MKTSKLTLIRPALLACAAAVVPVGIAGAVWQGVAGALGAVAGVALVAVGFVGSWMFTAWAEQLGLRLVFAAGVMGYIGKIGLVAAAFLVASRTGWSGMMPMAMATIVGIVAVLTVLMIWAARMRLPLLRPEDSL
ncbi:hypothetical protein [Stackebrandtia albiflava]|uniref:hypothetical protein n=1 Tax=Stackebrandtia albiflava TaxID=406432 RepID=UPI0011BF0A13|nr:hypothetical protein [Stackebrandtia albiflava]